ncbi:MAG: hypothetical protein RR703_00475 [Bacilli bacterium]
MKEIFNVERNNLFDKIVMKITGMAKEIGKFNDDFKANMVNPYSSMEHNDLISSMEVKVLNVDGYIENIPVIDRENNAKVK